MFLKKNRFSFSNIPEDDLVSVQYDEVRSYKTKKIILILSTPRSGSTLLCDLVRVNGIATPHEYFQHHQYMQILARRWKVERVTENLAHYADKLLSKRTTRSGVFACNIHASHINNYVSSGLFGRFPHDIYYMSRRDIIKQAVSYDMAHQTRRWSSAFAGPEVPSYSYRRIRRKLEQLCIENVLVKTFLEHAGVKYTSLVYEEFLNNKRGVIEMINGEPLQSYRDSEMKKQSNDISKVYVDKFKRELMEAGGLNVVTASSFP